MVSATDMATKQNNCKYREIRPREAPVSPGISDPPGPSDRQALTRMACDNCRKSKTKCDGQRPVCSRCQNRKQTCVYQGAPDETPSLIAKRKAEASEQRVHRLEELFHQLATRSDRDAFAIYKRIRTLRSSADLDPLIDFLREGELLAQLNQDGYAPAPVPVTAHYSPPSLNEKAPLEGPSQGLPSTATGEIMHLM